MNPSDLLLLTISLSVAVQLLRRRFVDKKADNNLFRWLLFADVPLVIGGIVLVILFNIQAVDTVKSNCWLIIPLICIDIAIGVLIRLIMHEWHWNKPSKGQ